MTKTKGYKKCWRYQRGNQKP